MLQNHYIKNQVLEPSDLKYEEKLAWEVLQMDCLMDMEFIYSEVRCICNDDKLDLPEYKSIRDAVLNMRDNRLVEEITEEDINLILMKRRAKEMESPKYIVCSNDTWGLG